MKRLLLINSVCGIGSTGKICAGIAKRFEKDGYEVKIAYGRTGKTGQGTEKYAVRIGNKADVYAHVAYTRITDKHGLGSKVATGRFLKWADEYAPDLLWLHNLHGYYINYELLFKWIKERQKKQQAEGLRVMQVKWTLHDCWAFTGHCSHFMYAGCCKWEDQGGCHDCPQRGEYPRSLLADNSERNYIRKKKAFTGVMNMTVITPSVWLKEHVKKSFLKEYPVEVVYNTINEEIFRPLTTNIRQKYNLEDKTVILGVSSVWNDRKGLGDFIRLAGMLDESQYQIILVGVTPNQKKKLSHIKNIMTISRVDNPMTLAEIYNMADFFVNPSREESFGLTTLEAVSCGVITIVYENTSGEEIVTYGKGYVVPQDVKEIYKVITDD